VAAGAISVVALARQQDVRIITGALGAFVTLIVAIDQTFQFQRLAMKYRAICEMLKSEVALFLHSAGVYKASVNSRVLLIERAEAIFLAGTAAWIGARESPGKPAQPSAEKHLSG
jgi:hypothetical protein